MIPITEKLVKLNGYCHPDLGIIPTRRHQVYEEMLEKQREFSKVLYYQKDLDRGNY